MKEKGGVTLYPLQPPHIWGDKWKSPTCGRFRGMVLPPNACCAFIEILPSPILSHAGEALIIARI